MSNTEESRVSRRGFMRAAGLGVASTALGATTITAAQAEEFAWDGEADVVVAGSGGAGLAAAVSAIQNGGSVIVLEKAEYVGGTTSKSGGGWWVPNNHHMHAKGIVDTKEDFLRYSARVAFPELYRPGSPTFGLYERNYKLLDHFYDQGARIAKTLDDTGALPSTMFLSWDGKPAPDYHAQLVENADIRGRQMATRSEDGSIGYGGDMIVYLSMYVEDHGGRIEVGHRVSQILRDETGRVIGLEATTTDGTKRFRAKKGVVFGTGGFTHNKEMATGFLRTPILGGCAVPTNEGDLILMSSQIGVKLGNLNEAWNQQEILEEVLEYSSVPSGVFFLGGDSSIAVNKFGQRMYDEKYVYPERGRSHAVYDQWTGDYPNLYQVFIFDEKAREFGGMLIPEPGSDIPNYVIQADTLEALTEAVQVRFDSLEDRIGPYKLDPAFLDNLKETIGRYNTFAETGKDTDFHRGEAPIDAYFHAVRVDRGLPNPYMAPLSDTGPYFAVLLAGGTLDTKGGPVFDENAQVVDIHDQPIPGLYVAGNAGASPSGKSYLGGGGTLGLGITFGYLAAEHAMKQA
ncbi:hypothetical protein WH87_08775 [Devosia epidermidihirudinis]|uniref:FAD-dependent oxidoreductase 2 FAD-binding domain-containing protein n=1 Tax=Devosia epidermidihirudinis TaxID=1293439 RepID=A0A0F5Q9Z4_9HYPH|nr:FAD-dependent oxidoreductase [Devosia epidermidihirudinis]KKC37785.1 hypothetical protein WH87_08775 [Devosia epidermidihirudinis]